MYTLDANIFVRDLDTREPQHVECHALLAELQAQAHPIIAVERKRITMKDEFFAYTVYPDGRTVSV